MVTTVCYLQEKEGHRYLVFDAVETFEEARRPRWSDADCSYPELICVFPRKYAFAISKPALEVLCSLLEEAKDKEVDAHTPPKFGAKEFGIDWTVFYWYVDAEKGYQHNYRFEVDLDSEVNIASTGHYKDFFNEAQLMDNDFLASLSMDDIYVEGLLSKRDALRILKRDLSTTNAIIGDVEIDGECAHVVGKDIYRRKIKGGYRYYAKDKTGAVEAKEYLYWRIDDLPYFTPTSVMSGFPTNFQKRLQELRPRMIGVNCVNNHGFFFIEPLFLLASDEEFNALKESNAKAGKGKLGDPKSSHPGEIGMFEFEIADGHVSKCIVTTMYPIMHRYGYGSEEDTWSPSEFKLSSYGKVKVHMPDWAVDTPAKKKK